LQDEKFLIPKSESDPTPRRPDALIKNKVCCLAAKSIAPIDEVNFRTRTVGRVGVEALILPPVCVFNQDMNALCAAGLG
jgi:hypothetical protein